MKRRFENLFWKLATAAIIANAALLWNFNQRLCRIEAKLGVETQISHR